MDLGSSIFLFLFLPCILAVYYLLGKKAKNVFLFIVNLFLYTFSEPVFILFLLASMAINFGSALLIKRYEESRPNWAKAIMILTVCLHLSGLVYFKYFTFLGESLNAILGWVGIPKMAIAKIALPIGISFFTFQAISYVVDVYKKQVQPVRNFIKFGVYFSLFAQITAGPIVRYKDVENQLDERVITIDTVAGGLKRFLIGLSQKILLANYFGKIANEVFTTAAVSLGGATAWVGILFYTLQIYFDFAGYSSMAIGLAKMLGFTLKENFNYPYISDSVTDFWRRWHISLSTWFRDYVYFSLGGNRKGKFRMYLGLFLVFLLSGIWHGASWNFFVWGLYHAIFIMLEKTPFVKRLSEKTPKVLKHLFTMLIVIVGWVFFRANDLTYAFEFLGSMLFIHGVSAGMPLLSPAVILLAVASVFGATPLLSKCKERIQASGNRALILTAEILSWIVLLALFALCLPVILSGTSTPFIYTQF
ncbi:MAG: MBOAT family protein [Clostridia bacterium]|nr:MBOAT family protein [Clostridia bacterium]